MAILSPLELSETLNFAEVLSGDMDTFYSESIGIVEAAQQNPLINIAEVLSFVEAMTTQEIQDILESLNIKESLPFNADAVFSDLQLLNVALDEFLFTELSSADQPIGFDRFTQLKPGDREYQKALLRIALRVVDPLSGDRLGAGKTVLNVDVPNVNDSAIDPVPISGTTITFEKTFNVIPNITVSGQSATDATSVEVSNLSITGFDVQLFKSQNDQPVAGVIGWAAKGF